MSRNISVYSNDTAEVAYAAYCNAPFVQRAGFKKLTKGQFAKQFPAKRAEYLAKHSAPVVAVADAGFSPDVASIVANAVQAALAALGVTTETPVEDTSVYKARTPRESIPEGAARNAVLWALNTEGFIQIVPEGGCTPIMQEQGTALLTATFGPLVRS